MAERGMSQLVQVPVAASYSLSDLSWPEQAGQNVFCFGEMKMCFSELCLGGI